MKLASIAEVQPIFYNELLAIIRGLALFYEKDVYAFSSDVFQKMCKIS